MAEEFSGLEFERPVIELENRIDELKQSSADKLDNPADKSGQIDVKAEVKKLEKQCEELKQKIYTVLTPAQKVLLARHPKRPYSMDYINSLFTDFIELHGDRCFADDKAVICGCAMFNGMPVVVIGQQKGRTVQENIDRNFGSMLPEGYRKALRVMYFAEKFNKPVITLIDTPGAYPGIGAEERGQSEAIARNLREMSILKTPIVAIVIGEGGSGGALGIGVADRILMLENAYYSVISPEGCASILFHDAKRSGEAAESLKLTAQDLYTFGVTDEIIKEPLGGAHRDIRFVADNIRSALTKHITELKKYNVNTLLENRYEKYRKIGKFQEKIPPPSSKKKKH
ncbi:MAG: acetyl-CoA carboxylase carboxyltransferase subunit alpha [Elusimicrobia bacterium CG1_02_37_114]|nr:MAG: acetyl-CoA carboxylase carboxyltransferase subunit alpha [Elusimicrobia bacterium CG1_02_37_114]PIZ13163.1 MAG: acetyl-CoA carboxylase carboxyl transferase subunit alpha [Elusimicrobia bacterium CG_4_10_14_0_8_um_filter_37_32]